MSKDKPGKKNDIKDIARSRFELLSQGPEPCMIDLYTIGLRVPSYFSRLFYLIVVFFREKILWIRAWDEYCAIRGDFGPAI